MNGVHDMGGMANLGAIAPEPNEPVFHHDWEARVHAMTVASPTRGNIDAGRHQRELIPGPQYLAMSYYEKWFASLTQLLLRHGLVTPQELATGRADPKAPKATPRLAAGAVTAALTAPGSYVREAAPAQFAVGDAVRARNLNPPGHTRLPRYVRGRQGVVTALHGAHVFPDSNAHDKGEDPQPLYTVRFAGVELWGEDADPGLAVSVNAFESYLEPARGGAA